MEDNYLDQLDFMDFDANKSESLLTINDYLSKCHVPSRSLTPSEFSNSTASSGTSKKNKSTKSRKKRITEIKPMINQIKVHIPSVPKLDIRLHYFKMLNNIQNAHNCLLLRKFLEHYCRPDCSLEHRSEVKILSAPGLEDLVGIQTMYEYWRGYMLAMPDGVVLLKDFEIFVSSDHKSSRIVADIVVKGTQLFDIPVEKWIPSYNKGHPTKQNEGSTNSTTIINSKISNKPELLPSTTSEISELKTLDRELQADRPMIVTKRIEVEIYGTMILELDRNKFIKSFILEEKQSSA